MQIAWQKASDSDGIRILRVYSNSQEIIIPDRIAGFPVTEIGAYCFSASEKPPKGEVFLSDFNPVEAENNCRIRYENNPQDRDPQSGKLSPVLSNQNQDSYPSLVSAPVLPPACGNFISEVTLPDSVTVLHNAAFYNCRKLSSLSFGPSIVSIGSDEFTNCQKLKYLKIRASIDEPTGLKTILERIESELFVSFIDARGKELSMVYFPEYYEWLDEISPAHIFSRSIHGEGYRMRKSFNGKLFDYNKYDACFKNSLNNESDSTIINIAFYRLLYPNHLDRSSKEMYQKALEGRSLKAFSGIIKNKNSGYLQFLIKLLCSTSADLAPVMAACNDQGWAEGATIVMEEQQKYFQRKPKTFSFD